MSSSDQQYPYPYDPERQQPPSSPHWPDGTAGQSAAPRDPAASDQGGTQTWQAPTWDTQYQPTIRPDGEQHRAQEPGPVQGQGYGQPRQPGPYGTPQPGPYGQQQPDPYGQQQPGPYATPEPHPPYQQQYQDQQQQYQDPQQHQPHQPQYREPLQQGQGQQQGQPQQPYRPSAASAADTAYLPPQGASGSYPLPPEVPATPAAPVALSL
ncbi:hypothetical protein HET64_33435, partial [Streptomyces sp. McG3]|nr:hypothetical protein [Streptomyces sp. McG3]